ncbi:glycosyltransferase [Nonomuraea sediminis]|uniref:glycosyltransferase n=1 Tax=Nonomuraea sediminis TaxID=2835864 RepID=UPI001BDCC145|nr:nucleotide disphospho-sugar-binding domain-containing protein [Nonomuraea sediminis]
MDMSRYLIYTAPGSGHLYPLIPTMLELRARGHEVVVMSERDGLPPLRDLGFEAEPIAPEIEARGDDTWKAWTPIGAMRRSVAMYVDRARYEVADLWRALAHWNPDFVLVDNNCWGAAAAAQAAGVAWAQAATFLLPLVTPDAPPFGLGLKPSRHPLARLRDAILARSALPIFDVLLPPVNAMRRELGLRPVKHVPELYMQAPLVLSYTAAPLEYHRTCLPRSVRFVGPGEWDPPAAEPAWLAAMRRPIVLVTGSTLFQDDAELVQTALDALAGEPYDVVATTASLDPSDFRVPANAHVERFVPHSAVLRRAAAVVCHGGMGITQKALLNGVPVCVVPFGRDQLEVARRVDVAGAGVRLPKSRLRADDLRAAVRRTIGLKEQAERAGERLRAAGGARAAADALEQATIAHSRMGA